MHSSSASLLFQSMVGRGGTGASARFRRDCRSFSRWTAASTTIDMSICPIRHQNGLGGGGISKTMQNHISSKALIDSSTTIARTRHRYTISKRSFRTSVPSPDKATTASTSSSATTTTPLDAEEFQSQILSHVPTMAASLIENGYYTTTDFLPMSTIATLRNQSISLRFEHNRFEASYSETIDETTGRVKERFDKEGVYACEPDGRDYYDATDLVTYMSLLLQTLPVSLNAAWEETARREASINSNSDPAVAAAAALPAPPTLSNTSFNAKLAVTEHGGAKYPLHVDNPQGLASGDTRKLTCILYLNPHHEDADGGEIRLFLPSQEQSSSQQQQQQQQQQQPLWETMDLSPIGGRLLAFWSDEIPHEVLSTASSSSNKNKDDHEKDRYALTIWIPTSDVACLHNASSKFHNLKDLVFEAKKKSSTNSGGDDRK